MGKEQLLTNEVADLLTLTRDLQAQVPNENAIPGLGDLSNTGLADSGPVVINIGSAPHIVTKWGKRVFA